MSSTWLRGGDRAAASVLCILGLLGGSCASGSGPPPGAGSTGAGGSSAGSPGAGEAPAAADESPSEKLQREFLQTEAGRALGRSVQAHGGLEAWLALEGLRYERTDRTGTTGGGEGPEPREEKRSFHFDRAALHSLLLEPAAPGAPEGGGVPAGAGAAAVAPAAFDAASGGEDAAELEVLALPLALASPRHEREYLGVEADAASGSAAERVRFRRRGGTTEEWVMAYFEVPGGLLVQTLRRAADGAFVVTRFSDWRETRGVRIAGERRLYFLGKRASRHFDPGRPDRTETLGPVAVDQVQGPAQE